MTDFRLLAYDDQLRTDAETAGATSMATLGTLRLAAFGSDGMITYPRPDAAAAENMRRQVPEALAHYRDNPAINRVEWKTRGHDRTPGLHEALLHSGFTPEEPESIMIGEATSLAVDVDLPAGVTLRRVTAEPDVRAMAATANEIFGVPPSDHMADVMLRRLALDDGMELWVAEAGGQIIGTGRLDPVPGTDFAGIWGGTIRPQWRGRGIYRALTAARARSALLAGKTLINSDSTEYSRPILERSGLVKVSTTTPYVWRR